MAISVNNTPAWEGGGGNGLTADRTVTLPTHASGDRIYIIASWKDYAITCTISGWTELFQGADGTTVTGNGTGSVKVGIWYKDCTSSSETNPTIDWGAGTLVATATCYVLRKGGSESWSTPVVVKKAMTTWTTSSQTESADATCTVPDGAIVIGYAAIRDDSATFTRPTTGVDAASGITWAADYVEQPAAHQSFTTGNDGAADCGYRMVTTGGSGITLRQTATLSAAETGMLAWIVQGVFTPEVHTGSVTATGGGVATYTAAKKGSTAVTATGGGVATYTAQKKGLVSVTGTGGGVATYTFTGAHVGTATGTGGGIATTASASAHFGTSSGTGGGTGTTSGIKQGLASVSATASGSVTTSGLHAGVVQVSGSGGGSATQSQLTSRFRSESATGGGTATLTGAHLGSGTGSGTGGGSAAAEGAKGAIASVSATASGAALLEGTKRAFADVTATGGGTVTIEYEVQEGGVVGTSVHATGGGTAVISAATVRLSSVAASGSGVATVAGHTERFGTVIATGGGDAAVSVDAFQPEPPEFRELAEAWFTDDPPPLWLLRQTAEGTGLNEVFSRRGYAKKLRVSTEDGVTTVKVVRSGLPIRLQRLDA